MRNIYILIVSLCWLSTTAIGQTFHTSSKLDYGRNGRGVIISKFDAATNALNKEVETTTGRSISGSLLKASDGKIYGITEYGGKSGDGTIFSFDPVSNTNTTLYSFDQRSYTDANGLIQAPDGKLYGMINHGGSFSDGFIFSFDPSTNTFSKLHDFDHSTGAYPTGNLVLGPDGKLYGTASSGGDYGGGTVFSITLSGSFTKLHDFDNTDGRFPFAGLLKASDGKLYGTTYYGGVNDYGTIYSMTTSGIFTKLYDFDYTTGAYSYSPLMQASNGKLYGMTYQGGDNDYGTAFSYNLDGTFTKVHDFDNNTTGAYPYANFFTEGNDGNLYAPVMQGGNNGYGTIISLNPSTNAVSKLYDFDYLSGANPTGNLIESSFNNFIGATRFGGGSGFGVLYSFNTGTHTFNKLNTLSDNEGWGIYNKLTKAPNGKLYSMTYEGGVNGYGTIYSFDPSSNALATLVSLDYNTTGAYPFHNSFKKGLDGKLYSAIATGGTNGTGTIISFDPSGNSITKLADFPSSVNTPVGEMVQALNGVFYGTFLSSTAGRGGIFSFDPNTNVITILHTLSETDGTDPYTSLALGSNGKLYGMTGYNGANYLGTIFSFDIATNIFVKLHDFDGTDGEYPYGNNFVEEGGKLYSEISGGGSNGFGTIISIDILTGAVAKLHDFDYSDGAYPYNHLTLSTTGKIYGLTNSGGAQGVGTVFSLDPVTNTFAKLQDFDGTNGSSPEGQALIENTPLMVYYRDEDGDGFGDAAKPTTTTPQPGYVTNNTDCNDANASVYPGAQEVCDGIDNNCNDEADEGLTVQTYYRDSDGDGFGTTETVQDCKKPAGYSDVSGDCDDNNAAINPGATEVCDGIDNNCDGNVDEGNPTAEYFLDGDGDTYGDPNNSIEACRQPAGYVSRAGDCNDNKAAINPGATEVCDGLDNDCDGLTDEGFTDLDKDGQADCIDADDDNDGTEDAYDCDPRSPKNNKFLICHNGQTLCVDGKAWEVHKKHGDALGACPTSVITFVTNEPVETAKTSRPQRLKLNVYPNPSSNFFKLGLTSIITEKVQIKVVDLMGRVVFAADGSSNQTYTFGEKFSKGSYFVKVMLNGKQTTLKLSKQ